MQAPLFYVAAAQATDTLVTLPDDTARHVLQVLRMPQGASLQITNGAGLLLTGTLLSTGKKQAAVQVTAAVEVPAAGRQITLAISVLKNAARLEWFFEKATEMGVTRFVPLLCERTERSHFRYDRMQALLISALQQSRQLWLPHLDAPTALPQFLQQLPPGNRLLAHCADAPKQSLRNVPHLMQKDAVLLIGPEGDFTAAEIEAALAAGCQSVSLGTTRLRTETAGVVGAALLCVQ